MNAVRVICILGVLVVGGLGGAVGPVGAQERASTTVERDVIDHSRFDRLLARFVDENGTVDYSGLQANADAVLAPYLQQLETADLSGRAREARLAFWINAYNALTLKLIVDHYPVENVWAITPGPPEPKDDSPFALDVGTVADTVRTLDEIEHEIIRERFDEPRIHFALVCAAASCPPLRREAYTDPRLDAQLDDQARTFLHNDEKNRVPAAESRIALSRILKWYGDDFGPTTDALQRALAPYFENTVRKRLDKAAYEVTFRPYDWALNDQAREPAASGKP